MDWTQVLVVVGANLATILTMYLHLDNKTSKMIGEMQQEMKDFHGRLARQDAEFKAGLLLLEEKFRDR